jgi:CMP-2-keto-3-deoxyoctulosonic acid synthetase
VTGKDLEWAVAFVTPCTFASPMQHSDWGNSHSVSVSVFGHASMEGFAASYFQRGHERSAKVWRHVGVYVYDAKMLADYLQHAPTSAEESQSLEQLRTMAMGYSWHVQPIERPLRSVNVPADVEQFKEDARKPLSQPA